MSLSLPLSPQVFAILGALVEERMGLHYDAHELDLFAERVSGRAIERGFESLLDYYYFLRYDPAADAELALLADGLVVNETYFFRELTPLRVLVGEHVPRLLAQGIKPRIWCAACSTGEEPLTLAMLLDEAGILGQVAIVAATSARGRWPRREPGSIGAARCARFLRAWSGAGSRATRTRCASRRASRTPSLGSASTWSTSAHPPSSACST